MNARQQRAMLKRQAAYSKRMNAEAEAGGGMYLAWLKANNAYGVKESRDAFVAFMAGWTIRSGHRFPIKAKQK